MSDPVPVVTSVTLEGLTVGVEFEDGFRAIFQAYIQGAGYDIKGLRHFHLYNGGELVARYNGKLSRYSPADVEHCFEYLADGYTPEQIAEYWEAAWQRINHLYFEGPLHEGMPEQPHLARPWRILSYGAGDLTRIKEGQARLPVTNIP